MRLIALLPFFGLFANPSGLHIVSGHALLNDSKQNVLEINVADQSVLEWDNFSIGENECARFIQESSRSTVLNRVTGPYISAIDGLLQSNGSVFLINSSGVLIGKGAIIDCTSLFISAISLSDQAFSGKVSRIVHQGKITARSGDVHLASQIVENFGEIWATEGNILVSGSEINHFGVMDATSKEGSGGRVSLSAPNGIIDLHGAIHANGKYAGGEIAISSDSLTVHPTALISAEGSKSGGSIFLKSEKVCFQYGTLLA